MLLPRFRPLLAIAAMVLALRPGLAATDVETVTLRAASPAATPSVAGDDIKAYFAKPRGPGPFGAVVALHGCGGMSPRFLQEMTDRLTAWGYAVLVIDSFAYQDVKSACGADRARSRADQRPADAVSGLRYLATRADVDPKRVALLGYSQGAWVALELAQSRATPAFALPPPLRFKAAAAYYPDCRAYFSEVDMPTLIMTGERDDWTPASRCQQMLERRAGRGAPLELVVYPDAHHGFDWIDLQPPRRVAGYLMAYQPEAARQSIDRLRAFLAQHIGP
ncbi:dienelactone hydrolase family protein [Variovorax terrae]|uniref:Dienelactone hydrolase family protein n=1 Tax=Variovorax terrae TaxID=2923278 RepID=A0A9X1VVC9_9BURK|nr:dienelactone hydrolase family protein [Variovorax terrae]MCJ0764082.1 dienelactone hydrolase family protein [Variovorax terrae]